MRREPDPVRPQKLTNIRTWGVDEPPKPGKPRKLLFYTNLWDKLGPAQDGLLTLATDLIRREAQIGIRNIPLQALTQKKRKVPAVARGTFLSVCRVSSRSRPAIVLANLTRSCVPNDGIVRFGLLLASGFLLADFLCRLLRDFLRSLLRCFLSLFRHEVSPPFWLIRLTRCARMSKHLCVPG